jgi:hypothetical protein
VPDSKTVPDKTVPDIKGEPGAPGHEAPAFMMPVERGKVREFALATGSRSDEYLTGPRPVIPPTFLRTSAFWAPPGGPSMLGDVKLDLRRVLHGEQEYTFFGEPPRAGTELRVTQRVESVTEKQGKRGGAMIVIVFVSDFTDASGRLVARGRQTLIQTGKAPS